MFSSSVRRVAFKAPQSPIASLAGSVPRAASQASYRCHQRRFSSSKPSNPADGSNPFNPAKRQALPTSESPTKSALPATEVVAPDSLSAEKKSQRAGKRKGKIVDSSSKIENRLPSVPSTHHIRPEKLAASDFFSLHRPISPNNNFPQPVTDDAFAKIFTLKPKSSRKPQEVISTLSNALNSLESATGRLNLNMGPQQAQWNSETDELRAAITAESYRKGENQQPQEIAMDFPNHILSDSKYQPFHPPPPPMANTLVKIDEVEKAAGEPQYRRYTTVITIDESTDANGEITYSAHSSPLQAEPSRFLERMQIRQMQSRMRENDMLAISVKRQRKLKMKKHKYKKLMRRTRNLRRRLDRN